MTHRYPFSVIHPSDHYGRRVATYFNLAYKVFSVKDGGKHRNLLTHAGTCTITDVAFRGKICNSKWQNGFGIILARNKEMSDIGNLQKYQLRE